MRFIGIDYSMSCPAICIWDSLTFNGDFAVYNCEFYYKTAVKKYDGKWADNLHGEFIEEWVSPEQRYANCADWALGLINDSWKSTPVKIMLEGYSYGSSVGMVFNIAENTSILKNKMWEQGLQFELVAPPAVKKFATGKGTAGKEKMQETFMEETGVDLKKIFGLSEKAWSPSGDIIDSYYICKYGATEYFKE